MNNNGFSRITFFDKLNTSVLMLFTPERAAVRAQQQLNGYLKVPTYSQPSEMGFEVAQIGAASVRYARSFREGAPTIVLLSPLPQSILAFAPIWEELKKEYDLLALDLPGFGGSSGGREYMNFTAQGEFLAEALEFFEVSNAHIVGPDVGMPAALHYAGAGGSRVKSLFIGDGPSIAPSSNGSIINKMVSSKFWQLIMGNVGAGPIVEGGNRVGYVNYVPNTEELSDYKKSYTGRMSDILQWFIDYPASLSQLEPVLPNVSVPTLIFWGENDVLLLPENGERLQRVLPNSQLKVIPNCGHFAYQDQSEVFVQMLQEWISEHA